MASIDGVLDRSIPQLGAAPHQRPIPFGAPRDRLSAISVGLCGLATCRLRQSSHVSHQWPRYPRRGLAHIDLPVEVHRVVDIDANPCELVMLLLPQPLDPEPVPGD